MAKRFELAVERKLLAATDPSGPAAVLPRHDLDGIAWEPFSKHRLEQLVNGGKTAFVDFTADWCLTCKANEAAAIERPEVARLIRENGVVALRADKTKPAPEVDETLRRLGNKAASIPFYAIFSSNSSRKPILLDGLLTSPEPIVQAFRRAGPSRGAESPRRTEGGSNVSSARRGLKGSSGHESFLEPATASPCPCHVSTCRSPPSPRSLLGRSPAEPHGYLVGSADRLADLLSGVGVAEALWGQSPSQVQALLLGRDRGTGPGTPTVPRPAVELRRDR